MKTYNVIFTVIAPEGFDKEFYPGSGDFDDLFYDYDAEIQSVAIEEEE